MPPGSPGGPRYVGGAAPGGPGTAASRKGGLIAALVALVLLLGIGGAVVVMSVGDDGEGAATTTSRRRTTTTDEEEPVNSTPESTVTSFFPPTIPLGSITTVGTVPPNVPAGLASAEQVAAARLSTADVGGAYVEAAYGPDEPYCGQPVVISSLQRSNVAFEDAANGVRLDHDIQAYADETAAAADIQGNRALIDSCPITSTTVNGTDYFIGILPYPEAGQLCDETLVAVQVATPFDSGPTVSRAIGAVRCGRNIATFSYAVVGRDWTDADQAAFDALLVASYDKLAVLPR